MLAQDLQARPAAIFCGTVSDTNFGKPTSSPNYNPEVLNGWGTRPYHWEFSAGVQHAAAAAGWRWTSAISAAGIGNFAVTDNLDLGPSDYGPFSITAPVDPRLPDGGGYTVSGFYNLNPDRVGAGRRTTTSRSPRNYGKQIEHWNGVDVTVNARLRARHDAAGRHEHRPAHARQLRRRR